MKSLWKGKSERGLWLWIALAIAASLVFLPHSAAQQSTPKESEQEKLLKQYANQGLNQLKYSIKNDGFFSNRVALNIWESLARDAGVFDEVLYNQFKEQIYRKSINESLKWFDIFVNMKSYSDASTCLQLWKMHSEEIGIFNEEQYTELKKKLK